MLKKHALGATLIVALAVVALAQPVAAGYKDQPPPQPGWTHPDRYRDDTSGQHGIKLAGGPILRGSPVIAEVDGNAGNGREVVVGGVDGRVYAYRANGTLLWEKRVPDAGCSSFSHINSRPTVGPLMGGSTPYVLVGYGPIEPTNRACDGGVVVFRGPDGQQAWNFSLQAFESQTPEPPEQLHAVIGAPAIADTDGDGRMEVAFGGLDRNVYLLNGDGSVRWYYHAADTVFATPLFLNVDGDPQLELIVATDITANPNLRPPTQNGGFLHAFETAPRSPARIPFQTGFIWRTFFDQALYSSPLAADLLPNSAGLEVAIGSGCYFGNAPDTFGTTNLGRWVKIVNPATGAVLQTLNAPGCVQSSPAAGDIDGDGRLEIVATVMGAYDFAANRALAPGRIVAWDPESPSPKWERAPGDPNSGSNDWSGGDLQSPVIADLDGNGSLEVLAANFWSVHVLRGDTGAPLTCQGPGCGSQLALFAWGTLKSTPAVGDLDGDGDLEVVIGGTNTPFDASRGLLYAWTNFAGRLGSPQGNQQAYSAPWPQLVRTPEGRALLAQPGLTATVRELRVIAESGETREYRILIGSADGSGISPSASVGGANRDIVSASVSGRTLTLGVSAAGKGGGTYTAMVNLESPGVPDLPISVTLRVVGDVTQVGLPTVNR
ncbi:MAG TPA: VCBS repeat-containing protein [Chloroflexaceae bacterium]|nr:VCBS repeat-containing protein [Chloroflexaceae bacterium]